MKKQTYSISNLAKAREKGDNCFSLIIPEFTVNIGQFVAVVGASGCGKSTLLDLLGLILMPDSADKFLVFNGNGEERSVVSMSEPELALFRKESVGYVLQTGGLLPFLTVRENIMLPCQINNITTGDEKALEMAKRLKIDDQLDKKPQYLSGGQRQRVAISRALSHQPAIVLADEPTAAVDKLTAKEIINEFKILTSTMSVSLVMVTHDLNLVVDVADRLFTFELEREGQHKTRSICVEKEPCELAKLIRNGHG